MPQLPGTPSAAASSPTPYDVVAEVAGSRRVAKPELLSVCRDYERRALSRPPGRVVVLLQDVRFAGPVGRGIWARLAAAGADVTVLGRDVPAHLATAVRGRMLDDDDPLTDVWGFLMRWSAQEASAMVATDVAGLMAADPQQDDLRDFDLAVTDDSALVGRCLELLGAG